MIMVSGVMMPECGGAGEFINTFFGPHNCTPLVPWKGGEDEAG
jgi:hypothetical protein